MSAQQDCGVGVGVEIWSCGVVRFWAESVSKPESFLVTMESESDLDSFFKCSGAGVGNQSGFCRCSGVGFASRSRFLDVLKSELESKKLKQVESELELVNFELSESEKIGAGFKRCYVAGRKNRKFSD